MRIIFNIEPVNHIVMFTDLRMCLRAKINPFSVLKKRKWRSGAMAAISPAHCFNAPFSMDSFTIILVIIIFTSSKMY